MRIFGDSRKPSYNAWCMLVAMTIRENSHQFIGRSYVDKDIRILVLHRGWVVVGYYSATDSEVTLRQAAVVRRWGTTKGLGEIAAGGPTAATILGRQSQAARQTADRQPQTGVRLRPARLLSGHRPGVSSCRDRPLASAPASPRLRHAGPRGLRPGAQSGGPRPRPRPHGGNLRDDQPTQGRGRRPQDRLGDRGQQAIDEVKCV